MSNNRFGAPPSTHWITLEERVCHQLQRTWWKICGAFQSNMFASFVIAFLSFVLALSVHRSDLLSTNLRSTITMAAAGDLALPPLPYDYNALEPHIDEV